MFRHFGTVPFISVKILALSATFSTFIDQLLMSADKPHKMKELKTLDKQKYTMYIICTKAKQLQQIAADVVIIIKKLKSLSKYSLVCTTLTCLWLFRNKLYFSHYNDSQNMWINCILD